MKTKLHLADLATVKEVARPETKAAETPPVPKAWWMAI
jgi:hypothetical protein